MGSDIAQIDFLVFVFPSQRMTRRAAHREGWSVRFGKPGREGRLGRHGRRAGAQGGRLCHRPDDHHVRAGARHRL